MKHLTALLSFAFFLPSAWAGLGRCYTPCDGMSDAPSRQACYRLHDKCMKTARELNDVCSEAGSREREISAAAQLAQRLGRQREGFNLNATDAIRACIDAMDKRQKQKSDCGSELQKCQASESIGAKQLSCNDFSTTCASGPGQNGPGLCDQGQKDLEKVKDKEQAEQSLCTTIKNVQDSTDGTQDYIEGEEVPTS